jgi:hypothetical protein
MYAKHEPESWSTGRTALLVPSDGLTVEGSQNECKKEFGAAGHGQMVTQLSLTQTYHYRGRMARPCMTE